MPAYLVAICRLFFGGLGFRFAGALPGLVVRLLSSLRCFFACAIDGLLCFSDYGLAGFFRFLAYGLGGLFCFLANRFSSLLCFLTCCFQSVFNCFAGFLRAVLDVLNYALLAETQSARPSQPKQQLNSQFSCSLPPVDFLLLSDRIRQRLRAHDATRVDLNWLLCPRYLGRIACSCGPQQVRR